MLQAFVDGSGTGDPDYLVIAGFVAEKQVWEDFSREWTVRLEHARIPCFKMAEMARDTVTAGFFYRTLEEFDIRADIACVVNTRELREVEAGIHYPAYVKNANEANNPYYWAFKYITAMLAQRGPTFGVSEKVDFIFDNETEKVKIPQGWEVMKSVARPEVKELMGECPSFRDDRETPPLQAADLYAWWVLKWTREGLARWPRTMPFPWGATKRRPSLAGYFGRRSFLSDISGSLQQAARTQAELDYAQSLMPDPWEVVEI